jgi:hypothetical protein
MRAFSLASHRAQLEKAVELILSTQEETQLSLKVL